MIGKNLDLCAVAALVLALPALPDGKLYQHGGKQAIPARGLVPRPDSRSSEASPDRRSPA
jgi:hypothetical protein